MSVSEIQKDTGFDHTWGVLAWEETRLLEDPDAADLAPGATALLARWAEVDAGQRAARRAEILAQARVDAQNDKLDDTVDEVDREMLRIEPDRDSARYRRYFKKPRNEIVRLGLESQLGEVRTWPGSLQTEPEPALQQLGARMAADVSAGDAAVLNRDQARATAEDFRVRALFGFIDEVNAARRARYGALVQRAEERGLPRDWPSRFFRKLAAEAKQKAERRKKKKGQAEPQPPTA